MSETDIEFGIGMPEVVDLHSDPTKTVREFASSPEEDATEPLVTAEQGTILPAGGLGMLAAKAADGKTTIGVDFSLHAAEGMEYVGLTFPRKLKVLWIQNEGPREAFRAKLEARLASWPEERELPRIWDEPSRWGLMKISTPEARLRLQHVVELHDIDLVLSDSLTRFGVRGNGTPEETREFMEWLAECGLGRSLAFLILHHPRTRTDPGEDELERIAGAWQPHLDLLLNLKKTGGNRARLAFAKTRWAREERPASILAYDPETQSFEFITEVTEAGERDLVSELKDALKNGIWRTVSALREPKSKDGVGAREEAIREALTDAAFEHALGEDIGLKTGANYYRLRMSHGASVGVVGQLVLGSEEKDVPRTTTRKGGGAVGGTSFDPRGGSE